MLGKSSKAVSLLLAVCMLMSMLAIPVSAADATENVSPDADKNVAIFMEAEDGKMNKSTNTFEKVSDKTVSGKKYIVSSDTVKPVDPDLYDPEITWSFDAEEDGTYYVWMRYWCENNGMDSVFIGFNDQKINSQYGTNAQITGEAWGWCKMWSGSLKAGKNKLKLYHREYGMKIDCFYITKDSSFVPSEKKVLDEEREAAEKEFEENRKVEPIGKLNAFDGQFCEIEAESSASANLIVKDNADASGKKAVEMPKVVGYDRDQPIKCNPPHVTLSVDVPRDGMYAVYVRVFAPDAAQDTAWICWDTEDYKKIDETVRGEWHWYQAILGKVTAGTHTLNFVSRESGMLIDKVIITSNLAFIPSGIGDTKASVVYEAVYPTPSVLPLANQHPRVYFTADDIPRIKANMTADENAATMKVYKVSVEANRDGTLQKKDGDNYNGVYLGYAQAKAFEYAINGDVQRGNEAITIMKNFVQSANSASFDYNTAGHTVAVLGMVYDWCYDLLDEETKNLFIGMVPVFMMSTEVGWPPTRQGGVVGHGAEGQIYHDLLSAGIAMYDERPDIYINAAGRIFREMVEPREFFYQMQMHPQGAHYAAYRFQWEMLCTYLFDAIGYPNVFGEEQGSLMYHYLYTRRPDGGEMVDGDGSWNFTVGTYVTKFFRSAFLAGNYFKDPYIKKEAQRQITNYVASSVSSNQSLGPVEFLVFNDPSVETKSFSELPLTHYNPSPKGGMVARTSWADGFDSPAVIAEMKVNEYWTANHQHLDAGSFQIYYKGALATDTGYYQAFRTNGGASDNDGNTNYGGAHWTNYYQRTIAHNSMLVYDPDENFGTRANDGGQRIPNGGVEPTTLEVLLDPEKGYKTGETLAHEFGLDPMEPNYSYVKGDIADAYSDKVENFERSFMFLNLKNEEHPAAMVVFDRVVSSNKDFKKTWLCHGMYEPQTNGQRTVFTNTGATADGMDSYNGKLTIDTILPANASISKVGGEGHQHEADGVNWLGKALDGYANEGDGWRVEVSPSSANEKDYFLNVMQVGDADGAEALPVKGIETDKVAGAVVADRVVIFGKERDRTKDNVEFSFDGEGSYEITVADLEAGTWSVAKDGGKIADAVVTEDGGVAVFNGEAGAYTLSYENTNSVREAVEAVKKESEGILVKVNGRFIYSDVEPVTVDDRTLIPMRAIFEKLGVDVTWDEATATATAKKGGKTVKITENSTTAYINDTPKELDVPAMILNGRFVVPIRFVSEAFDATVGWQEYGKIVTIKAEVKKDVKEFSGESAAIEIKSAKQTDDDGSGNDIKNSYDNDLSTRWAAEGNDGSAYGIYDLGEEYKLKKVMLAYHNGSSRVYNFDIAVSNDGTNFTNVITGGKSSGSTSELESYDLGGVKARYIKYIGYGNTENNWNSLTEIVFVKDLSQEGYATVNKISASVVSEGNGAENVLDGDLNTLWAEEGEVYLEFELDREYTVENIELIFNPNSNRSAIFEVYYSTDGENWSTTKRYNSDPSADGKTWEKYTFDNPLKAKYIRYAAFGSDKSMWNGVKEIRFKVK